MDVPKRHVVEGLEGAHVHVVEPAHGELRVASLGRRLPSRHELVRHAHVSAPGVYRTRIYDRPHGVRIAFHLRLGKEVAHRGREEKRNGPYVHGAIPILERHRLDVAVKHRGHMNALPAKEPSSVGHAFRGVMVAVYDHGWHAGGRHLREEPVHERDGLGRGGALVVEVAGDEQRVDGALAQKGHHLREHMALLLEHGKLVDPLAYVQVRNVQEPHSASLLASDPYTACGRRGAVARISRIVTSILRPGADSN